MKKYCFGIDIGGTTVKCGLFNVDGEVLDKWEIKTRTENNGENIIADIAETMNAKIAEKGLDKEEIVGAGVGVPGPADEEGNVPVAVNLHWGFVPLSKELSEKTGLAVRVGNDANVAALGEMWKGGAVGYHNVVVQFRNSCIQCFCLRNGSRESVQYITFCTVCLLNSVHY